MTQCDCPVVDPVVSVQVPLLKCAFHFNNGTRTATFAGVIEHSYHMDCSICLRIQIIQIYVEVAQKRTIGIFTAKEGPIALAHNRAQLCVMYQSPGSLQQNYMGAAYGGFHYLTPDHSNIVQKSNEPLIL